MPVMLEFLKDSLPILLIVPGRVTDVSLEHFLNALSPTALTTQVAPL